MKRLIFAAAALTLVAGVQPRADLSDPRIPGHPRAEVSRPVSPPLARHTPTMAQFMSAAFPLQLVAAKKADRIAWISNDKGLRNVFTAAAPDFRPVRVTSFMKDDGVDTTQLSISDDGATVTFTRGHDKNRAEWVANPEAYPQGVERALWAAKTVTPGLAWRLAEGENGV